MFGIPLETITLIASTGFAYWMKMNAQKNADMIKLTETAIKANNASSSLMDAAAERSSPVIRKTIAIIVITVMFVGVFALPFFGITTEYLKEIPKNSILWGLIKWGKGYQLISSEGFLIPPYMRHCVMAITGFFFGPGFAKVSR